MKRGFVNAVVDVAALAAFAISSLSGLVSFFILPSHRGGWSGSNLFAGLHRGEWVELHTYSGVVFFALAMIHILLHWRFFLQIGRYLRSEEDIRE